MKKSINSNLGIFLVLLFSILFTFIDYLYISNRLVVYESDDKVIVKYSILSDDEALSVGNNMYDMIKNYYIYYGPVVYNDGKDIYYEKNDDDSFSIFSDEGYSVAKYTRLDVRKFNLIASSNFVSKYVSDNSFIFYNGNYFHKAYPRSTDSLYVGTELKIVSVDSDVLLFDAVSTYSNGSVSTDKFKIINSDGYWKIDEFVMPY